MDPKKLSKDLINDPLYKWLDQDGNWHASYLLCGYINFAFRLILFLCFGWVVAAASYAAALVVQQVPLLLNVVCHIPALGYKNFDTDDDSVNVWWVSFLTTGEGWHNNHHAFPGSARHGFKPHEVDPAWITIKLMQMVGLVSWVREENIASTFKRPPAPDLSIMIKDGIDTAIGAQTHALSGKR
jgi:stearoyl-CoA desaturase (delta-9 desaturase)